MKSHTSPKLSFSNLFLFHYGSQTNALISFPVLLTGVFHLIHTAFEEYVFLVVENQMIVEMDTKLNRSLESHLKKG